MQDASEQHPIQFFTATILEWKHLLKPDKYKDIIISSLRYLTAQRRIEVFSFVIMPNHIHLVWRMGENTKREHVQRDFLKFTSQQIIKDLEKNHPLVLEKFKVDAKDCAYQVWERNALSVDIYSRKVLEQKLDYIHNNPVQEKCLPAGRQGSFLSRLKITNIQASGFMKRKAQNGNF